MKKRDVAGVIATLIAVALLLAGIGLLGCASVPQQLRQAGRDLGTLLEEQEECSDGVVNNWLVGKASRMEGKDARSKVIPFSKSRCRR